ncbi:hypothetical protein BJ508DRAFT_378327 [Ascobolus immersus RN42]|uniref:Uncharacterized protein n=1 Tax=Ascobolus immersus RN42 TaxID=1160509 RepID=A0A3N4I1A3_ASCIM|nr:hypothetical protein BJ508DRAFT_378327 [Ascobolus immersus RN42]
MSDQPTISTSPCPAGSPLAEDTAITPTQQFSPTSRALISPVLPTPSVPQAQASSPVSLQTALEFSGSPTITTTGTQPGEGESGNTSGLTSPDLNVVDHKRWGGPSGKITPADSPKLEGLGTPVTTDAETPPDSRVVVSPPEPVKEMKMTRKLPVGAGVGGLGITEFEGTSATGEEQRAVKSGESASGDKTERQGEKKKSRFVSNVLLCGWCLGCLGCRKK